MKKLSKETMIGLFNNEYEGIEVSDSQHKNFTLAMGLNDNAPNYMYDFCKNYKPNVAGKIENLQADKMCGKMFVITSAQNNTKVHTKFLKSIEQFCDHNFAQLIVGKFVYNKNGFQNGQTSDDDIYYDKSLEKFYHNNLTELTDDLFFCGNLNILPTAKFPLSGFENYQGSASCIIPTSKIALESVATMKNDSVKFLYGTGTITLKNYIQKKAGQVAESMHSFGAVIVEFNNSGDWFVRQIETDDTGIFQDLTTVYHPNKVVENTNISSINFGDFHSEKMDYDQLDICTDMVSKLKPDDIFLHDLFDMSTRNHHNKSSGHFLYKMQELGNSVLKDLENTCEVLNEFKGSDTNIHIVESNHDQALEKWLDDPTYNYRLDPQNAKIFLELQLAKYNNINENEFILLEYALNNLDIGMSCNINFMQIDQSFVKHGIEFSVHGHIGSNGSRGNPKQYQKLNKKMNTGHTHTASIYGNVYTAGVTGLLDMGYNKGASSWSHSHIITYNNGFRTIITTKNGIFCK